MAGDRRDLLGGHVSEISRLAERNVRHFVFVVFLRIASEQHLHAREQAVLIQPDVRVMRIEADESNLWIIFAFEPDGDEGVPEALDRCAIGAER